MKKLVLVSALFAACMMSSVWAGQIVGIQKFVVQKGTNVLSAVMFGSPDGQFLAQPLKRQLFEYRAGDTFVWTLDGKECVYRFDGAHWYDAEGKDADEVVLPSLKDGIVFVREVDERSSISISGQLSSDEQAKFDALTQRQGSQVAKRLPMKPTLSMKPSSLHRNGLLEFGRFLVFWGCIIALPMMLFARLKKGYCRTLLRYGVLIVFAGAIGFLWLAPSCDRFEEAHGFLKSGKWIVGNGVTVGVEYNGVNRFFFVTCRHVLVCKMLSTGSSFVDAPAEDNRIFFNKPGCGFRYSSINNIDPARWMTCKNRGADFAWIELTRDELDMIVGQSHEPACVWLSLDTLVPKDDFMRKWAYAVNGFDCGSEVSVMSLFSPVTGSGDPRKMHYWPTWIHFTPLKDMLAVVYEKSANVNSISARYELPLEPNSLGWNSVGVNGLIIDGVSHVNKSGSPVFASTENDSRGKLLGVIAGTADGNTIVQPIDPFVIALRDLIVNGKSIRLLDLIGLISDK